MKRSSLNQRQVENNKTYLMLHCMNCKLHQICQCTPVLITNELKFFKNGKWRNNLQINCVSSTWKISSWCHFKKRLVRLLWGKKILQKETFANWKIGTFFCKSTKLGNFTRKNFPFLPKWCSLCEQTFANFKC